MNNFRYRHSFLTAAFFGGFQALMPLMGWLGASLFRESWLFHNGHWISFILLSLIGGKMIWEGLHPDEECPDPEDVFKIGNLLLLAVATSIDALAVGMSLAFLGSSILLEACIIGIITFGVSWFGVFAGHRLSHLFGERMEEIGGTVLILIGIRIILGHYGIFG